LVKEVYRFFNGFLFQKKLSQQLGTVLDFSDHKDTSNARAAGLREINFLTFNAMKTYFIFRHLPARLSLSIDY